MEHYVGLDVSLKLTAICIVDRTGKIEREGVVSSDPEAIAIFIKSHAPHVARVGLETGATATWLWTELNKLGLPVICIDARHAKAALKMQINKSDRNIIRSALELRTNGHDPLKSDELDAALSNCLSCKGCTPECPSNVNLAPAKGGDALRTMVLRDEAFCCVKCI